MSLPGVIIDIANGALGGITQSTEKVVGIIVSAPVAPSGMALGTAKFYSRLSQVEDDGLDADFDTTNSVNSYRQIKELYSINPDAQVWIMPVIDTVTMKEICDKTETPCYLKKLLEDSEYAVNVVGVCRVPNGAYVPTYDNGLDDDVADAIVTANSLAEDMIAQGTPVIVIIEGRDYQGVTGDLVSLKTMALNHCAVVICGTDDADLSASVGLVLGAISNIPVQRNIGRVKNGALPITEAYLSDGTSVVLNADIETIHDKGYITIRKFLTRAGFYFSDDPTATADTDDLNTISKRRVINKAVRYAVDTYTDEINEEVILNSDGTISVQSAKYIQSKVESALKTAMLAEGNCSDVKAFVDPAQNVLTNNKITVRVRIIPVGQSKEIEVELGFTTSL